MSEGYKGKILLIKLSSLGDVIFNIPLANSLKKAGYNVTWLVSEKGYDIINGNSCVDSVIEAPFGRWKKVGLFTAIKEIFLIIKHIREEKFDIAIDTQGRWKSLVFMLFSGIKRRIAGSDGKEFSKLGATEIVKIPKGWDINVVEKYMLFAEELGVNGDIKDMSLPDYKEDCIQKFDIPNDKPIAVLCPTTTWKTKHWDKNNWKKLVKDLEQGFSLVFTGMKADYNYIEEISNGKGLNLAGKTNIKDLISLFKMCNLVVSLDSGSTHLARAANAEAILSIFCSTPEMYYAPIGDRYRALGGKLKCRPCHKRLCKNGYECTKLPSEENVLEVIKELFVEESEK